jgi:hypothetical protein
LQTWTPLIVTSMAVGSKTAAVVPTWATTRPQFGSSPKIAALNRAERATDRETSTASASLAAPLRGDRDVVVGAFGVDVELVHEVEADLAQQGS